MKKIINVHPFLLVALAMALGVFGYCAFGNGIEWRLLKGASLDLIDVKPSGVKTEEKFQRLLDATDGSDVPDPPFTKKTISCGATSATNIDIQRSQLYLPSVNSNKVNVNTGNKKLDATLGLKSGKNLNLNTELGQGILADTCYLEYVDKTTSSSKWKAAVLLMAPPFERWALAGENVPAPPTFPLPTKAWGPSLGSIDTYYGDSTSSGVGDTVATSVTARAEFSIGGEVGPVSASIDAAFEEGLEEANSQNREITFGTTHALDSDVDSITDHGVLVVRTRYYSYKYRISGGPHNGSDVILNLPYAGQKELWTLEQYNEYNDDDSTDLVVIKGEVGSVDSYPDHSTVQFGNHTGESGQQILNNSALLYSPNTTGTTTWEHSVTSENSSSSTRSMSSSLGGSVGAFGSSASLSLTVGGSSSHTISFSTSSTFGGSIGSMDPRCKSKWDYTMTPHIYWARYDKPGKEPYRLVIMDYYVQEKGSAYSDHKYSDKLCRSTSDYDIAVEPHLGKVDFGDYAIDTDIKIDSTIKVEPAIDTDNIAVSPSVTQPINDARESVETAQPATTTSSRGAPKAPATTKGTPSAEFEEEVATVANVNPFSDTDMTTLAGKAAADLHRRGIIGGYPDGEFKGARPVNRAEAAKFLLLASYGSIEDILNSGRFWDVLDGQWYTKYVVRAAKAGIISGYADGSFKPANTVNTAEFLKMLTLAFGLEDKKLSYSYSDVLSKDWFARYAGVANEYKLFPDRTASLLPAKELTRADVAIALYQFFQNR